MILFLVATCTVPNPNYRPPGSEGCTKHEECASGACVPGGACADTAAVAYVDPTGTDNTECMKETPCTSLDKALATGRPTVKMTGTTMENVRVVDQTVTVIADTGAKLVAATPGNIIEVVGASEVSISDLEISGATGPQGVGLSVQPGNATVSLQVVALRNNAVAAIFIGGGSTATVTKSTIADSGVIADGSTLNIVGSTISRSMTAGMDVGHGATATIKDSTISNNRFQAIDLVDSATVNVIHSMISDNQGDGLFSTQSTLNVSGSTITRNGHVGIQTLDSTIHVTQSTISRNAVAGLTANTPKEFHITNNFIVQNGTSTTGIGGAVVRSTPGTSGQFEFNTIAENHAMAQSLVLTGGVDCVGGFAAPFNLLFGNTGGQGNPPTLGDCNFGNSLSTSANPGFKGSTDYHLTGTTPSVGPGAVRDAIVCAGVRDIDDEARPQNGKCDYGADEFKIGPSSNKL